MIKSRAFPASPGWIGLVGAIGHLLSVNAGYSIPNLMDLLEMLQFFGLLLIWE